ncbi:Cyclin-D3-2 protein [Spatholobus suberectus]|nr:Cyclin-D3-2 protein [Spatholobus suberectus]
MMPEPHSPSFLLCQEHCTFQEDCETYEDAHATVIDTPPSLPSIFLDNHLFCEHDHLLSLLSKERATRFTLAPRHDVVRWISRVSELHGFTALTTVLAVNYFDRFVASLRFQREKPWMTQLAAVACVSLAAKVEETRVPLLLDLQVEESKFVFEAKTIKRMELLVLSTLQWKMNPVTPISFFRHILTGLRLKHCEFLCRCERLLLSLIADSRVMSYLPSTLAAAIMIHVIKEIEPFNATEYRNQLLGFLKSSEEQVNGCYKLMLRLLVCCEGIHNLGQRRKRLSEPISPAGVIDASFSCETSNDSWTVASLSVEPVFKRRKAQEQQMRLHSVNRVAIEY